MNTLQHFRKGSNNEAKRQGSHRQLQLSQDRWQDNVEPRRVNNQGAYADAEADTSQSTAAQSNELPKSNLLRKMHAEKAKAAAQKRGA